MSIASPRLSGDRCALSSHVNYSLEGTVTRTSHKRHIWNAREEEEETLFVREGGGAQLIRKLTPLALAHTHTHTNTLTQHTVKALLYSLREKNVFFFSTNKRRDRRRNEIEINKTFFFSLLSCGGFVVVVFFLLETTCERHRRYTMEIWKKNETERYIFQTKKKNDTDKKYTFNWLW